MEKLNELISKACLASEMGKKGITVDLQLLSHVRDEFWALEQRAVVAEQGEKTFEDGFCSVRQDRDEWKQRAEAAEVEKAGAEERCRMMFDAKNHWSDRARSAEAKLDIEWTNEQCLEFLSIAFRNAEVRGDIKMDDIRLAVKMINAGVKNQQ